MEDNKLFKCLWYATCIFLSICIISIASCNVSNTAKVNDTVARMVTEGVDPKSASCAVAIANNSDYSIKIYCSGMQQ